MPRRWTWSGPASRDPSNLCLTDQSADAAPDPRDCRPPPHRRCLEKVADCRADCRIASATAGRCKRLRLQGPRDAVRLPTGIQLDVFVVRAPLIGPIWRSRSGFATIAKSALSSWANRSVEAAAVRPDPGERSFVWATHVQDPDRPSGAAQYPVSALHPRGGWRPGTGGVSGDLGAFGREDSAGATGCLDPRARRLATRRVRSRHGAFGAIGPPSRRASRGRCKVRDLSHRHGA